MSDKKPVGLMCAITKEATVIPDDVVITRCRPSTKGIPHNDITRPRKGGRVLSWEIAESLAPDANLSYDQQEAKTPRVVRRLTPAEAQEAELREQIRKLRRENASMKNS